ncbi:MAG TPA: hypothetical protein VMF56_03925 [Acidobacteriaceae bacterium]|nr:hypothetical protein [Acidobacteriaceae bacterium]
MTSSPKGAGLIATAPPGVDVGRPDRVVRGGFDPGRPQPGGSPEATTQYRAAQSPVVAVGRPPRILLVEPALELRELHLLLLRSIPAIVETLACCADMYLNQEPAYALVILVLDSQTREIAAATRFVRHRWSAARILLLESEPTMIDDWLYDERVDPRLHPATVREAAIRLMTEEKYWIPLNKP